MAIVLFVEVTEACAVDTRAGALNVVELLCASGHSVRREPLHDLTQARNLPERVGPPAVIVADLSAAADLLPLRHLRRALVELWDGSAAPPVLVVLSERHLRQPEWPALVDDFLLTPLEPAELVARIHLLLFRHRFLTGADDLRFAGTRLDLPSRRAFVETSGQPLPLTPREYELLCFLFTHRGKFFTRERLLDLVWGVDFVGGERTVDIHVRRLRAKLPPETATHLETRRTVGYGFATTHEPPR